MEKSIIITNIPQDRGFAFAMTMDGEQVFIPPYAKDGMNVAAGDRADAVLVPNTLDTHRNNTPWMAVRLMSDTVDPQPVVEPEPAPAEANPALDDIEARDHAVMDVISSEAYVTVAEIAEALNIEPRTAGNSAQRLFHAGRVARAEVHRRPDQQRASFVMYASDASLFVASAE